MRRIVLLLVIVISCVVMICLYLYKGDSDNDVVIIGNEDKQFKRKPLDPGGIVIPNSDSHIYDQLKKHSAKTSFSDIKMLPSPEEPVKIDFDYNLDNDNVSSIDDILNNLDYYEGKFLVQGNKMIEEDIILPNKIIKEDEPSISANNNQNITYNNITSLNVVKASVDVHKTIAEASDSTIDGNGYFIQLAITHSEKEARAAWAYINKKHSEILSGSQPVFKKINKNNSKIFILVLTGPYANQYKAKVVCSALKKNNQNCMIMK